MDVTLTSAMEGQALSPILGRTVYRLVQEALTNARKHAPGQVVAITIEGEPTAGVRVEVVNRPRVGQAPATIAAPRDDVAKRDGKRGDHVGRGWGSSGSPSA